MNPLDYLILAAVLLAAVLVLRSMIRKKSLGGCCGSCASCSACSSCAARRVKNK